MKHINGISAVIPNYNGIGLLPQILPPLYTALQNTGLPYEVIIADDFSGDDSIKWIKANYPQIIITENSINKGFAPTANKGMWMAKYSHALLMNSDVKLSPDYFDTLYAYFDEQDTFGVMGRIIGWDDNIIQDGGKYPAYNGTKIKTSGNYIPVHPKREDRLYSFYLSGANAFIDTDKFRMLGGFNELFAPFYVEDFELSLRAWRIGFKCYYDHFAVCRHRTSITINTYNKKGAIKTVHYRNKMLMHALHLDGGTFKLWSLQNKAEVLMQSLLGKNYYKAAYSAFRALKERYKKQKEDFANLQASRNAKLSTKDVIDMIRIDLQKYNIQKI